jgi:hypothetical protein
MKKSLKKFLGYGLIASALYVANSITPRVMMTCTSLEKKEIEEIASLMRTKEYLCGNLPKNDTLALDYVKLAHLITMNNITLVENDIKYPNAKEILESRMGDCSEFSSYTYANFLFLTEQNGVPSLAQKVRFAYGKTVNPPSQEKKPHAWLEIDINDKWEIYETTSFDIKNNIHPFCIQRSEIQEYFCDSRVLRREKNEYFVEGRIQLTNSGKKHMQYTMNGFLEDLTENPGVARILVKKWLSRN